MNRILSLIEKAEVNYLLRQRLSFAKCDKISAEMCKESDSMALEMDCMVQGSPEWRLLLKVRLAAWDEGQAKIKVEQDALAEHYTKYFTEIRGLYRQMHTRVQAELP